MIGQIHITPFPQELIEQLTLNRDEQNYEIFEREDFKIDDAKEVITQSYLAHQEEKLIILCANKYNHTAQNALLKITEEPPENMRFILIAKNKNALLPTIRSRMQVITHKHSYSLPPFDLPLINLTLEDIYNFCKDNDNATHSKEEIKLRIQSLLQSIYDHKIKLSQRELQAFDKAIALNQNDATERENYIFLPLLLNLLLRQRIKK